MLVVRKQMATHNLHAEGTCTTVYLFDARTSVNDQVVEIGCPSSLTIAASFDRRSPGIWGSVSVCSLLGLQELPAVEP